MITIREDAANILCEFLKYISIEQKLDADKLQSINTKQKEELISDFLNNCSLDIDTKEIQECLYNALINEKVLSDL